MCARPARPGWRTARRRSRRRSRPARCGSRRRGCSCRDLHPWEGTADGPRRDQRGSGRGFPHASRRSNAELPGTPSRPTAAISRSWRDFLRAREVEIDDASADDLEAFAGALERAGLAPATRRRRLAAALARPRATAAASARVHWMPAPSCRCRACRSGCPRVLSAEQCKRLVEHPDATPLGLRDRAALELLYGGGLRVSELTGLRPGDLDLERGIVRVEGKGGRQRVVPTGRLAAEAAGRYLARGRPYLGKSQEAAAFLLNACGRRISRQGVFRLVRNHAAAVGIEQAVTPHVCAIFRHTPARAGAPICGPCRSCSGTPRSRPPRSIRTSATGRCARRSTAPTRARDG